MCVLVFFYCVASHAQYVCLSIFVILCLCVCVCDWICMCMSDHTVRIYCKSVYRVNRGLHVCVAHCAFRVYSRPLQSDGDTAQQNEEQNHVVKQLVRDHMLATDTKPEQKAHTHFDRHYLI